MGVVFYFVPPGEFLRSLFSLNPSNVASGFFFYLLSQVARALRWKLILKEISFLNLFLINSINIMTNNILPARSGELSWFIYASRLGVKLKTSLKAFFIARGLDLLAIAIASLSFFKPVFGVALLIFSFLGLFLLKRFLKMPLIGMALLSLTSYLLKLSAVFVAISDVSDLEFMTFGLAFAGGELTSILPVHSFMGLGTYEMGFGGLLKLLGLAPDQAFKVALLAHSFLLFSSIILGVVSLIVFEVKRR